MVGKILVLDDEENYAEMLQNLLQQHRFIVDSATKPEKALEALREKGYDLVISDYKMPVMDGADFLQKSREIKPDLPVILVSGLMNTPELVKVANMSVTLVLEKPIDIGVFIDHVRRFVSPLSEAEYQKQLGQEAEDAAAGNEFIRTYPADLRYVADSSASSRQALQSLWDASRSGRPMVISGPSGTEFELIVRELALWCFPDGAQPEFLAAADLTDDKVTEITGGAQGRGGIYGITQLRSLTAPQQDLLCRVLASDSESGAGNVVAVFLEDGLVTDDSIEWQPRLLECLVRDPVRIAPLQDRVADLAEYAARLAANAARKIERPDRTAFSDKCIHFLLQYPWPGNYTELAAVIKAAAGKQEKGAISTADLVDAVGETGGEIEAGLADAAGDGLGVALQRQQNRVFSKIAVDDGVSVETVAESVVGDSASFKNTATEGGYPLLFPKLLKPGDS